MALGVTKIYPPYGTRGASGTLLTMVGTDFGAAQGGSTLTVGDVAVTVVSWGDTEITFRLGAATPLGAQHYVLTVGGVAYGRYKAIHVYVATSNDSNSEIVTGAVAGIYIDGVHVGEIEGEPSIGPPDYVYLPFRGQDRYTDKFRKKITASCPVAVTIAQVNSTLLALALSGSYDGTSQVITVSGAQADKTEHSLLLILTSGVAYKFDRALITSRPQIVLAPDAWQALPFGFTVYPTNDDQLDLFQTYFPS